MNRLSILGSALFNQLIGDELGWKQPGGETIAVCTKDILDQPESEVELHLIGAITRALPKQRPKACLALFASTDTMALAITMPQPTETPPPTDAFDPDSTLAFQRRMERAPEWFCSFLAGNSREKSRLRREMATMRGSVVWLVQQRRQGTWSAEERAHLRDVMRTASSVSPYLFIWVIPGSMLLLPFMAWFLDKQRKRRERKLLR